MSTSRGPREPSDRLQGLLDRYTLTMDDSYDDANEIKSARSYFLARVAERRYAAEVKSFNFILESYDISESGVEVVEMPRTYAMTPLPTHGRATHRRLIETPKSATDRVANQRLSLGSNEHLGGSSSSRKVNSIIQRVGRSRQSLGSIEKPMSSSYSVDSPSKRNIPTKTPPVPSRVRSCSPSLRTMKQVSDCGRVERVPFKSAISKLPKSSVKTNSSHIPKSPVKTSSGTPPKSQVKTNSSSSLQHSAEKYRRYKKISRGGGTLEQQMDLTPAQDDDVFVAASLFSMSNTVDAEDCVPSVQARQRNAILNLKDFHSGCIKSKVTQKSKFLDDQSISTTSTASTSLLYGVSQSMSDLTLSMSEESVTPTAIPKKSSLISSQFMNGESKNEGKCVCPSRQRASSQLLARAERRNRRRFLGNNPP